MVGPPSSKVVRPGGCVAQTVRCLSTRVGVTLSTSEVGAHRLGSHVLLKVAVLLLVAWLLGVVGLYDAGTLVHVLLLVGLMLLLLGALKARDAAGPGRPESGDGKR
jgi:hypothetical protein